MDTDPLGVKTAGTYQLYAIVSDYSGSQTAFTPANSKAFVVKG